MLTLVVKNKFVSLRGSSMVKDKDGNDRFRVVGKVVSIGRKKRVETMDGKLLYTVRNKIFTFIFHKCYITDENGKQVAFVKQRLKLFGDRFVVEGADGDLHIEGDLINRNYTVVRNGVAIGEIKQHLVTLRDGFTITAYQDADAAFLVALVIAIDNIYDSSGS